jgi:hypothetical protein
MRDENLIAKFESTDTTDNNGRRYGNSGFRVGSTSNKTTSEAETIPQTHTWQNPFTDVSESDWFYSDVEYAYTNGLMNGVSATEFAPTAKLSRAMLVTVLYRYASSSVGDGASTPSGKPAGDPFLDVPPSGNSNISDFTDIDEISAWASEAMNWAVSAGLINGVGDGKVAPRGEATRAEAAALLKRYIENAG